MGATGDICSSDVPAVTRSSLAAGEVPGRSRPSVWLADPGGGAVRDRNGRTDARDLLMAIDSARARDRLVNLATRRKTIVSGAFEAGSSTALQRPGVIGRGGIIYFTDPPYGSADMMPRRSSESISTASIASIPTALACIVIERRLKAPTASLSRRAPDWL